jgi:hypothetical protein
LNESLLVETSAEVFMKTTLHEVFSGQCHAFLFEQDAKFAVWFLKPDGAWDMTQFDTLEDAQRAFGDACQFLHNTVGRIPVLLELKFRLVETEWQLREGRAYGDGMYQFKMTDADKDAKRIADLSGSSASASFIANLIGGMYR